MRSHKMCSTSKSITSTMRSIVRSLAVDSSAAAAAGGDLDADAGGDSDAEAGGDLDGDDMLVLSSLFLSGQYCTA
jgi:hypothetical protein